MPGFALRVDDDLELVLREQWTVEPLLALTLANQDRLARWEPWAVGEQTAAGLAEFTATCLRQWVEGTNVPTAVRYRGELVGSLGARINTWFGVAEIGYWIDASAEGKGLVSRAAGALITHLFEERNVARVDIRTGAENARSRAVAERLGFTFEGVRRAAVPVGAIRLDEAMYGLLATDPRPS